MFQSAYTGINNLYKGVPYLGGICKFWFIPVEEVLSIPNVNPVTQYLSAEPVLVDDKAWRGPVPVPDAQLGLTETQADHGGTPFWKLKLEGQPPGDVPQHRVNLDNMAYGQFIVVAKLRAGGFYILLGSIESPMDFEQEFTTGPGAASNAKNKIAFTGEANYRPLVISEFMGDDSGYVYPCDGPPPVGSSGGGEIIYFTSETTLNISWTPTRQSRFGVFPEIEVYLKDPSDVYYKAATQPYLDAPPPSFTTMYFDFGGVSTGFILIK